MSIEEITPTQTHNQLRRQLSNSHKTAKYCTEFYGKHFVPLFKVDTRCWLIPDLRSINEMYDKMVLSYRKHLSLEEKIADNYTCAPLFSDEYADVKEMKTLNKKKASLQRSAERAATKTHSALKKVWNTLRYLNAQRNPALEDVSYYLEIGRPTPRLLSPHVTVT